MCVHMLILIYTGNILIKCGYLYIYIINKIYNKCTYLYYLYYKLNYKLNYIPIILLFSMFDILVEERNAIQGLGLDK